MAKTTVAKKTTKKSGSKAPKKSTAAKSEKTSPSFEPEHPAEAPTAHRVERVNFDAFVGSGIPLETIEVPKGIGKVHVPKKSAKSLNFPPEVIDSSTEAFKQKVAAFTGNVFAQIFRQRQILIELAYKEFGEKNIRVSTGLSDNEVAFEVKGHRIPEEGFFFVRTQ